MQEKENATDEKSFHFLPQTCQKDWRSFSRSVRFFPPSVESTFAAVVGSREKSNTTLKNETSF